jgi:hypothetical protein
MVLGGEANVTPLQEAPMAHKRGSPKQSMTTILSHSSFFLNSKVIRGLCSIGPSRIVDTNGALVPKELENFKAETLVHCVPVMVKYSQEHMAKENPWLVERAIILMGQFLKDGWSESFLGTG